MDVMQQPRDANHSDSSAWPMRAPASLSAARKSTFQVVIGRTALEEMHQHGQSTTEVEVCGVLVGNGYRDEAGPYLRVEAIIRGTAAASRGTQVTFTADTWTQIQNEMDAKHPDRKILGWYHTHPGFGIFLSEMDLFIHENFFNLPWQIAVVYDPIAKESGSFVWREGKPEREPWLIESEPPAPMLPASKADRAEIAEEVARIRRREKWMKFALIGGGIFVALLAATWIFRGAFR